MIGSKELFEEMQDGDEYVTAIMPMAVFQKINDDIQEEMYFTIRQKVTPEDELHKKLIKEESTAKKKLRKFEFDLNHK